MTQGGGAVRDMPRQVRVRRGRSQEPRELLLGERRVGVRRREVAHQADDPRPGCRELREPHRPMPVSSLRWTGTPSGAAPSERQSSSRAARAAAIASGPAGPSRITRTEGSASRSSSASPSVATPSAVAPASSRGPPHVDGAVTVPVRLDDGPELGTADRATQHPHVVADRAEVDRDERAVHRPHCGDTLTRRSSGRPRRSRCCAPRPAAAARPGAGRRRRCSPSPRRG